jgi:mannose/cellobiose epimerase-like protein (N-acyl-D-glucosamine 2-epimerase family)
MAALIVMDRNPADEIWYRRLWDFADAHFIDRARGGWYPAIDDHGQPTSSIFTGKPDIYHSLQACLLPLAGRLSRLVLAPES